MVSEASAQACQSDQLGAKLAELRASKSCEGPKGKPAKPYLPPSDHVQALVKASR